MSRPASNDISPKKSFQAANGEGNLVEGFDIFKDISERTGGDIYVGVFGPVRTGKSTFIKRFMELLVLPNIPNPYERERAKDALPQSGAGRTVMTTEPKFVPDEGVEVRIRESLAFRVRMVDCVGFTIPGALGYEEDDTPRMVLTPWFEYEIPFEEAAEVGTRKVIAEHSTVGIAVLTDGTITDIPRDEYEEAEEQVVAELKASGKPFIILLNSKNPYGDKAMALVSELEKKFDVSVIPVNCQELALEDIYLIFEQLLYEFPVKELNVDVPDWVEELDAIHWLRERTDEAIEMSMKDVKRLRDIDKAVEMLREYDFIGEVNVDKVDMGVGIVNIAVKIGEATFYRIIEEVTGYSVEGAADLLRQVKDMASAKREYDRLKEPLEEVREVGYAVVSPTTQDMIFEEPELMRQGNRFGVKLRARAPSIHLIRADVSSEVTPLMGTEKQCEELVNYLLEQFEDNPRKIWQSDIFGKSLHELVTEGVQNKIYRMPENAQQKLQETVERIVNEGSGGLICIII
jgi:stage IV sporulation protein A